MKILFNILCLLIITNNYAHQGHQHHHQSKLANSYAEIFYSLEIEKNNDDSVAATKLAMIEIKTENRSLFLPESTLAQLVRDQIELYENIVEEQCQCNIDHFHNENIKRLPQIMKQIVNFFPKIGHFLSDLLWSEVAGIRRYGLIYLIVSAIGEIIDHNISPVPLCKAVAFLSRAVSDKIKTFTHLVSPYNQGIGLTYRMKALYSRSLYRRKYQKRWKTLYSASYKNNNQVMGMKQKFKQVVANFDLKNQGRKKFVTQHNVEKYYQNSFAEMSLAMQDLDQMQKMWFTDRVIDSYNFTYALTLDQAKRIKREKSINKMNFFKLQWDIGNYGNLIDKLKILLYVASATKNKHQRNKILEKIDNIQHNLNTNFGQYQILFKNIEKSWQKDSQLTLKNSKSFKTIQVKNNCQQKVSPFLNLKRITLSFFLFNADVILSQKNYESINYFWLNL